MRLPIGMMLALVLISSSQVGAQEFIEFVTGRSGGTPGNCGDPDD